MKTKRKNIFKSLLALTLALIMVLGVAPLSEFAGVDWASLFAPKAEADGKTYKVGDIIEFGSYPQSKVTDSSLVSALDGVSKNWVSYGYYSGDGSVGSMKPGDWMKYADFVYNGKKYRAVTFSQYRPVLTSQEYSSECQRENGYIVDNTYYFRYEPLKWRVLDPTTGLVICESIIDSQAYSNTIYSYNSSYWNDAEHTHYANDYATSSIRAWLNDDFYNTAFSSSQKASILTSKLDNRAYSTSSSEYDSETTYDKIFLLSCSEMQNTAYGFPANTSSSSVRRAKGTDYAKCQGLQVYYQTNDCSNQRLRSSGWSSSDACKVDFDGQLYYYSYVSNTSGGVRPALKISNLASGIFESGGFESGGSESGGSESGGSEPGGSEPGGTMSDEEMNKYIAEHINFHESKFDSFESNNGFYDFIWSDEKGRRLIPFKIWDVVGDVGEVATFKFDDLTISADYYELFLADFIMLINNKEVSKKIDYGVLKVGDDIYSGIQNALKSTDEWEKEINGIGSVEVEVKGFFTDPDYEISDKTKNILEKVLKEGFDKHEKEIDKVFSGLKLSSDIFGAIQDTTDIVNAFKDAQNAYQVALSYKNANEEVFKILYAAAEKMKETNPKHAKWFKESLDSYREKALNDDAIYSYAKSLATDLGWKAYDLIIKDFAKKAALNGVSKVLGCNPGKLGLTYATVTASYNLTYEVLNAVLPAGKAKTPYYLMHYISTFEKGLSQTVRSYGTTLEILKNSDVADAYKSAENYDLAFNMLRATNKYLYECSYNFCANNHAKDELVYATTYKNEWVNVKCHNANAKSGKSKFVSIQCPTNVSVYDSAGKRILSIVDGKIVECDSSITVMNYAGKKSFCYPADRDYRIKIDATADGSMNYYVCDIDSDQIERAFEFYDIPLKSDESFNGNIPAESDASGSVYGLKSSLGNDVSRSYDSADDCGDGKHNFCEWKIVQEPSCTEFGSEIRVCTVCKKQEYRITNIQHGQYELKNYKSNCESDGYSGDKYCSICGELIEKGSVITKAGHTFGSWQTVTAPTVDSEGLEKRVCSKCGAEETRAISKLEPVQVTDIELDITQKSLNVGDTFTLTATLKPNDATNKSVTWSSSDTSVATVDENGVVTAVSEGTATITATASNGVEASCTVTVKQKGDSILKKILKFILNIILAPFRAIINLFKKLFGK